METNIEWLGYPAHPIQGDIEVFLINHVHVMLTKETRDEWKPDGSLEFRLHLTFALPQTSM